MGTPFALSEIARSEVVWLLPLLVRQPNVSGGTYGDKGKAVSILPRRRLCCLWLYGNAPRKCPRSGAPFRLLDPINGTQLHERRLAFTLGETVVMTRLASEPRHSVEALFILRPAAEAMPTPWLSIPLRSIEALGEGQEPEGTGSHARG